MTSQANTIQALIKPKFRSPLKYRGMKDEAFKFLKAMKPQKTKIAVNQSQDKNLNKQNRYHSEAVVHWNRFNRVR
jgi:hypothetical protein